MIKMVDTKNNEFIAIIRVRGMTKIRSEIKDTMTMLGLTKKHSMVIRKSTPSIIGMIKKVKDYVTYGFVSKDFADKFELNTTVHLHPPRGGFERGGIKKNVSVGGALGFRGDKISVLISKMMPNQEVDKSKKETKSSSTKVEEETVAEV